MSTRDLKSITEGLGKLGLSQPDSSAQPLSHPDYNVVDVMRNYITNELHNISEVSKDIIFQALDSPNTLDKGDLIIPVPRLRLKGVNPKEKAAEWAAKFDKSKFLSEVKAEGPFLQFFFDKSILYNLVIKDVLKRGDNYGYLPLGINKKIIVEFSSPNIAKPFHAGHLRSTIIGGFLSNLYEKAGWDVERINYLGDWGKQFGVLAVGFEKYGSEDALSSDPINHLFEVYVKINADMKKEIEETGSSATDDKARDHFRKMEAGDETALAIWKRFRDLSIEKYIDTYARLNIAFDQYSGESQVSKETMADAMQLFADRGLIHEDRGAKLIDLSKFNKHLGKCLVQKSDGTSIYVTRDVGEAIKRYNTYKFDKMIYVIANQQDLHVKQFFEILKQMDFEWAKNLEHVNFGMVEGMSTRKGTVVFLDHILEETKEKMHEVMKQNPAKYALIENPEHIADLVGISAVMIQDMQSKRINNYEFKWERMLSFEGDTGPYLQYAHSRLRSVQRNSKIEESELLDANFDLLVEPCAANLIRTLAQYPDVIQRALKTHEPSTIVTYLFNLTHIVSQCYDILWVAGQEKDLAVARLALYASARQVLYNGMTLLGLTAVDRM
ncbi:arginyl-tRNA synthetase [Suhomyces tanzawaensis NRRL Y-17324]|uniref:arginine--tRNA ligase n=1 Tax=Suhomyces tanzawaensis NRRL Y-17324 TaxID=984487 RepID=A0A1E4SDK0_9ASCO|nr:arginyl-tRNA synthetase [Suhomyces tanzawaensis NRRL Y-17324]ODV77590.1 arginyl-tRNA synthetase [Suhomyces tanzawaensis NRRL Y-17324]